MIEMDIISLFSNPLVLILGVATLIVGYNTFFKKKLGDSAFNKRILYVSKDNLFGEELKKETETPKIIRTTNGYKFIKNKKGIPFNVEGKTIITWFSKVGHAWTYDLEKEVKDKETQIQKKDKYSLWDIMQVVLTDNELNNLKPDVKKRLETSEINMMVELEKDNGEDNEIMNVSEQEVLAESSKNMAKLISESVEEGFKREDYIKVVALVGLGIAVTYILQGLKILPRL